MTIELLYTSAAQGLKQGSRGFCTVVSTAGLPINLAQRLEALSGYRHLYQPGDPRADDNPICHSHIRLAVGGKTLSILSRVSAYGVDYSQRTNKIAHHVVFDGPVPPCGPASVLLETGIMRSSWDGECKTLQSGPIVPSISLKPAPCNEWQRITGDAGWAGVVANAWLQPTGKPVWIVFSESQSEFLLSLMQEAIAILPETKRWQATFSTYCTNLPPDVECRVRCVIAGSDEARMSIARGTVLDLTKHLGVATDGDAVEAARDGTTIGAGKILMPSFSEVSPSTEEAEDVSGDSRTLLTDTSVDGANRLQVDSRSKIPIPLSIPKQRPLKSIDGVSKSRSEHTQLWRVLGIAAVVLLLVSFIGTGTLFFVATRSPIAEIIENEQPKAPEAATKNPDLRESGRTATKAPDGDSTQGAQRTDTSIAGPPSIQLVEKQIAIIDENSAVNAGTFVAKVIVSNADLSDVTLDEVGSQFFDFHGGSISLKEKIDGYNFELTPKLIGQLTLKNGNSERFSIDVKNLDEPNLVLSIVDDANRKPNRTVFEGAKLRAEVRADSKDEDESTPLKRTFHWKGKSADGQWTTFEEKQDVVVDSRFLEVQCELAYNTTIPDSKVTTVPSESFFVQPLGIATIDFASIFFGLEAEMEIEVSFPGLPNLLPKYHHPFVWGKNDSYLEGKNLRLQIKLDEENQGNEKVLKIPASIFRSTFVGQDFRSNEWLSRACHKSRTVQENVKKLKESLPSVKSLITQSKVASAFKSFVDGMEASPDEKFFQTIDGVDDWIKQAIALKNLVQEIEKDDIDLQSAVKKGDSNADKLAKDLETKLEHKGKALKHLETRFSHVFPKTRSGTFSTKEAEFEIIGFGRIWAPVQSNIVQQNTAQQNSGQASPQPIHDSVNSRFNSVVSSIRDLRAIMDTYMDFETEFESKEKIKIWQSVQKAVNGGMSPRKSTAAPTINDVFRVRTQILFKSYKPSKLQSNLGPQLNVDDEPKIQETPKVIKSK